MIIKRHEFRSRFQVHEAPLKVKMSQDTKCTSNSIMSSVTTVLESSLNLITVQAKFSRLQFPSFLTSSFHQSTTTTHKAIQLNHQNNKVNTTILFLNILIWVSVFLSLFITLIYQFIIYSRFYTSSKMIHIEKFDYTHFVKCI